MNDTKISSIEPPNELLECFDDNGNIIQAKNRQKIHMIQPSVWHGVVNVWLLNRKGEILCSKRSDTLSGNPGKWQTYFGGHVKAGKTFKQTAGLELDEEIGLQIKDSMLYLIEEGKHATSKHFYESYAYLFEGDIADLKFNDGEITEVKWVNMEKYWEMKQSYPDNWCNNCNLENQKKIRQYILNNFNL